MDKVVRLGDVAHNGAMLSPKDTLEDAINDIGNNGALEKGKKLVIIALDDTDGCYNVTWYQCGMKMSECLTLCEVAKMRFFGKMGYLDSEG